MLGRKYRLKHVQQPTHLPSRRREAIDGKREKKIRNEEEEIDVILISLFCSRSKAVEEKIPILSSYIHCSVNNYYREEKSANYNKATHILV